MGTNHNNPWSIASRAVLPSIKAFAVNTVDIARSPPIQPVGLLISLAAQANAFFITLESALLTSCDALGSALTVFKKPSGSPFANSSAFLKPPQVPLEKVILPPSTFFCLPHPDITIPFSFKNFWKATEVFNFFMFNLPSGVLMSKDSLTTFLYESILDVWVFWGFKTFTFIEPSFLTL